MSSILIYSRGTDGHRAEYNNVLEKEFCELGVTPVFVTQRSLAILGKPIFFAMIEEDILMFIFCGIASIFTGNTTSGFLFRIAECFRRDGFKYKIKYLLFRALRGIRTVKVLTILPFAIDPRFAEVASDWIYDPQLWDSKIFDKNAYSATPLSNEVLKLATTRKVAIALGGQNRDKGFEHFCDIWCVSEPLRQQFLFVAAGKIAKNSVGHADRCRSLGGLLIDRHISEEELYSLYGAADIVWAAYSPDYDQASGIAGRAFQFGVPVVSRRNSYVARLMHLLHRPAIEIEFSRADLAANEILTSGLSSWREVAPAVSMEAMLGRFRRVLRSCVGSDVT